MSKISALSEARSTCDGLHGLIQKIGTAAVDIDKGGDSSYEMLALIASATTCVKNLETQLTLLEAADEPNVVALKRTNTDRHVPPADESELKKAQ